MCRHRLFRIAEAYSTAMLNTGIYLHLFQLKKSLIFFAKWKKAFTNEKWKKKLDALDEI